MIKIKTTFVISLFIFLTSCNPKDENTATPCNEVKFKPNITLKALLQKKGFGNHLFRDKQLFTAYVISDDRQGNFYKTLIVQDKPNQPESGVQIALDMRDAHLKYPIGTKLYIQVQGLSLGSHYGVTTLGIGHGSGIQAIPKEQIAKHLFRSCEKPRQITAQKIGKASDLKNASNTYIELNGLQFSMEERGKNLADTGAGVSLRRLDKTDEKCQLTHDTWYLQTSGYAAFAQNRIPNLRGIIKGIYQYSKGKHCLILNDESGLKLKDNACEIEQINDLSISTNILKIIDFYQKSGQDLLELSIEKPMVLEGYVIASNASGNFKNELIIQDKPNTPTAGMVIKIDRKNGDNGFHIGDHIKLRIDGLTLQKQEELIGIGHYKSPNIKPIPSNTISKYLLKLAENTPINPLALSLEAWLKNPIYGVLTTFRDMQIVEKEMGRAFTFFSGNQEGTRTLESCPANQKIKLLTQGSATFANHLFPIKKGTITGIPITQNLLKIRDRSDIDFNQKRAKCGLITPSKILITEVADPANKTYARFVELHNLGTTAVQLKNWKLLRYMNATSSRNTTNLSDITIAPKGFAVIANKDFEGIFKQKPTLKSSGIAGNGDDAYVLLDDQGSIHDCYGVVGEDGTGKPWEYLDGRAVRKNSVTKPSAVFRLEEWEIKKKGQNAPDDFTPFKR